jgi:iporin
MPNLKAILQAQQAHQQQMQNQLNVSEVATNSSQSSVDSNKLKTMLPMYPVPITSSDSESHVPNDNSNSNNEKVANPPSFNLVKLFIKQKSSSSDTCMDVSSGCWPSDSTNSSTEHPGNGSNSSLNRLRKKSMNDSGKCSTLSRHEEDAEYQLDSLDAHVNDKKTNDYNREIFDSPTHRRNYKDCALNIRNQMKNPLLYNVLNNNGSTKSLNNNHSQSDASRTSENLTQILKHDESCESGKMNVPIDMITKSIQTSMMMPQAETKKLPQSYVKMVPPSFLSQLSKLGDQQQAPVYVVYPDYALPDLEFINHQSLKMQKDIVMSPLSYQGQAKMAQTLNARPQKPTPVKRRPQSLDIDKLQQTQYGHVQDWTSLLTLLPRDYKKLLKNVPEVNRLASMEASMTSQKPMFCMSPPIRRTQMTCNCHLLLQNQTTNSSSSGGSSQPPSSGYRGSSTMLTDSEMEVIINGSGSDAMKNMFVYQYENVPDMGGHEQRPPTGRKGILRRTNTTSNTPTRVTSVNVQKHKRYSMIDQPKSPQQQFKSPPACQQTPQEKRRSLQEPNFYNNGLEEYFNNIGGTKNFANRLPNYMKARDNQNDAEKDLNQLMTELELNKALSNKLNYGQQNGTDVDIQDLEARLRAESFLNSIPKSELKHYAEVANLLEWHQQEAPIERTKLRNEVSKALASRKVQFNHASPQKTAKNHLQAPEANKKFATPPNSPQMSQLVNNSGKVLDKKQRLEQKLEKEKQEKIQSNRFKRLQIQWELLSKDAEERALLETKSGGTTPTGSTKVQSKIPRPVSYPSSK